jgi:ubiquinone biosynthesis protein UbiJ
MFTDTDLAFFTRLDARADAALAGRDSAAQRLRHALETVRVMLTLDGDSPVPAALAEVDALLDAVWFATTLGDVDQARSAAAHLAHAVADVPVTGPRLMRALSAALEVRSLVVVAA